MPRARAKQSEARSGGPHLATPTSSASLPDELLSNIFRHLIPYNKHSDYRPLYRLCLASRRFCAIAQPLLWEVVALELPAAPVATFLEAAVKHGRYTQSFELSFPRSAADKSGFEQLEHFGAISCFTGHTPLTNRIPPVVSVDLTGSFSLGVLANLRHLRAFACSPAYIQVAQPGDEFYANLEMLQIEDYTTHPDINEVLGKVHGKVPLLLSCKISNRNDIAFPFFPFHASVFAVAVEEDDVGRRGTGSAYTKEFLARLTDLVEAGNRINSLWLPRDLEDAGSPMGDVGVQMAWEALCAAAKAADLPGRLVGDTAEDPSPLAIVGGRLDWQFWEYAKKLRALGEV